MAVLMVGTTVARWVEPWGKRWVALKVGMTVGSTAAMKAWMTADSSDEEKGKWMAVLTAGMMV